MACNEFVMDLGECLDDGMLGVEVTEGEKEVKGRSWSKEKGRFICLVPVCKRKQVSFAQRFALFHTGKRFTLNRSLYTNAAQDRTAGPLKGPMTLKDTL